MSDARALADSVLAELLGRGMTGAGLVGRDGLPVLLRVPAPVQQETFSAMVAAFMGAAEAALMELGEQAPAIATIEAGRLRLAVTGLDDSHLLVLAAPSTMPVSALSTAIEAARGRLRAILGG